MKKLIAFLKSLFGKKEAPAPVPPAVVLTPMPVAPTPAPAPVAAPKPAPAPVAPVAVTAWPPGAYEFPAPGSGTWYVPVLATQAGPFRSPSEFDAWLTAAAQRDTNLAKWKEEFLAKAYTGQFPARNFIFGPGEGAEAAFIYAASRLYRGKEDAAGRFNADMYRDCGLFSGGNLDIAALINYGEQEQLYLHKTYEQTVADFPDTPVGRAVRAVLA